LNTTAAGQTQGCITPRTYVPWEVVAFAAAVAALAVGLIGCWMYFIVGLANALNAKSFRRSKMIKASTPNGVASWMAHAVLEHQSTSQVVTDPIAKGKLKNWRVGLNEDATHLVLMGGNAKREMPVTATDEEEQELIRPKAKVSNEPAAQA
jgi:hypothetical protein